MGYEKMLQDAINGLTVNNPNALPNHPTLRLQFLHNISF